MKTRFPAFLMALFIAGFGFGVRLAIAEPAAEYRVELKQVDDRKAVFGTVESAHETLARVRIAGTLISLKVKEGDAVKPGQGLALVQDRKLLSELAEIDARTRSLKAQRAEADTDLRRMRDLLKSGITSQAQLEQAQMKLSVADGQLAAAAASHALVVQQQAEGEVLAPVAGRILKIKAIAGSYVQPGEPVATIATEIHVLRIYLPERYARLVKLGDTVDVGAPGEGSAPEPARKGRVGLVYPELSNGRVVADIEVADLGDFFVGERIRVYVQTGKRETFVVPNDYVTRRYGVFYARLKDGGDVPVQPGTRMAEGIEILSGLSDGDVLVKP